MQTDEVDIFINRLLLEKNLAGVTDDVRVQLVADLKARLIDQINRALINAIPDDRIDAFNILLDDASTKDEAIQSFITESGVDVPQVTLDTMLRFSQLYLGNPVEPSE